MEPPEPPKLNQQHIYYIYACPSFLAHPFLLLFFPSFLLFLLLLLLLLLLPFHHHHHKHHHHLQIRVLLSNLFITLLIIHFFFKKTNILWSALGGESKNQNSGEVANINNVRWWWWWWWWWQNLNVGILQPYSSSLRITKSLFGGCSNRLDFDFDLLDIAISQYLNISR